MTLAIGELSSSGYGYGDGDGYGYGDGSGYGYGDGDGYGYGDGYGDGYWKLLLNAADEALWWSDAPGMPSNGGGHAGLTAAAPGVVHEVAGPLNLCGAGTLHATRMPEKWKGDKLWRVRLHGEVVGDDEKLGCLKREILEQIIPPVKEGAK